MTRGGPNHTERQSQRTDAAHTMCRPTRQTVPERTPPCPPPPSWAVETQGRAEVDGLAPGDLQLPPQKARALTGFLTSCSEHAF